ncbi:MAG: T9SS type A sorting domain-containing protein [Ignavibacteriales bacterium]|nr:T9SS type A sorting domain-containing protein [Ignavibacteriales bacterium]
MGGAPTADKRTLLCAASESWHLFDTIDVVKHSSGQIVHLPLDSMITLSVPSSYINNEQLQVPGVPMPEFNWNNGAVTYGIIDGTNIGYIYVYHHNYFGVSYEFVLAVEALMETDGLIIDIRNDWGGQFGLNDGISRLMNYPTSTLDPMTRCSPIDLFSICPDPQSWFNGYIPNDIGTYYDRPIAVLLGPNCASYGDISAWQFSYVPYVRTFGRSPKAIYSYFDDVVKPISSGYDLRCPIGTDVDHYNPDSIRWGQEYPLYEEVWLTPDGVANGEDDVVNRAVEWMNNLVFPHNVFPEKGYYAAGIDTAHIFSTIENPNSHQISARGYIKTFGGVLIDSVDFVHQLLNPSGELWLGSFDLPLAEEFYDVSVTSIDNTTGEKFPVPNATKFTTVPLSIDSLPVGIANNYKYTFKPFLKNAGSTYTLENIVVKMTSENPWVTDIFPEGGRGCPNLLPGEVKSVPAAFAVTFDPATFPNFPDSGYFNLTFTISSNSLDYWRIDTLVYVQTYTDVEDELSRPLTFNLEQNFPNPFNPVTTIKYQIPHRSNVSLKIYDIIGNEVADLINEEQEVGFYNIDFDASKFSSGVYFYRIQAGDFVQTRKMILLK